MAEVVGWISYAVVLVTLGCWNVVPTVRHFVLFFLPRSFSRPVVASSLPSRCVLFSGVVLSSRSLCLHSLPFVIVDDSYWRTHTSRRRLSDAELFTMIVGLPVTNRVRFEDQFSALWLVSEDLLSRFRHF